MDRASRVAPALASTLPCWREVPLAACWSPLPGNGRSTAWSSDCATAAQPWVKPVAGRRRGFTSNVCCSTAGSGSGRMAPAAGGSLFTRPWCVACERADRAWIRLGLPQRGNQAPWSILPASCASPAQSPLDPAKTPAPAPIAVGGEALAIWAEYGRLLGVGISSPDLYSCSPPELVFRLWPQRPSHRLSGRPPCVA